MMTGCEAILEDDFISLETDESVVIEGHVFTSLGKPIEGAKVSLKYEETFYPPWAGKDHYRQKAKAVTDASGKFRIFFEIRDDEIVEEGDGDKRYVISYKLDDTNIDNLFMLKDGIADSDKSDPGNVVEAWWETTSLQKGETYQEYLYIPQKRNVKITLTAPFPQEDCFFWVTNKIPYSAECNEDYAVPGPFDRTYYYKFVRFELRDQKEKTFNVACALNENNTFFVFSKQNGKVIENEHVIYVTEDTPESLRFDFTENLNTGESNEEPKEEQSGIK